MGQAWCKEKTSKAQDSKSPLDRVFVRCAHRIYPGLKEEGSVLGGATQRVTSSEIGYAGSPPREVLARGRSIDSVDRPFHPSEWVDVNLEVPSTPRPSSVLTNLTVDTSLYPATTPTSSCSNLKDATPVPPPRRRKRNKGRPLPPKPDEIPEGNPGQPLANDEPLYSSVKPPRAISCEDRNDDQEPREPKQEARKTKEIYEHKVNGTGRIIPRDVVSGKRSYQPEDRKSHRITDAAPHHRRIQEEDEDYERFAKHQSTNDSSTPSRHPDKTRSKEASDEASGKPARTKKNYSTVSLPNYSELDTSRHTNQAKGNGKAGGGRRPVRSSTGSLPAGSFLAPFSEKTSVRLEDYIPRRGSTENLSAYQVLGKLHAAPEDDVAEAGFLSYDPSKLEDWAMADIGNCELNQHRRLSFESLRGVGDEKQSEKGEDVVDFLTVPESRMSPMEVSASSSPILVQKPSGFGRTASLEEEKSEHSNGPHARIYEPPTLDHCRVAGICDQPSTPAYTEPFFLDEEKQRAVLDTIGGGCRNGLQDGSRMILGRRLSNESEPDVDPYESKELTGRGSDLIRTISEESLPREMLEVADDRELDDFFDVKLAKDARNKLKKDQVELKHGSRTPPPSPEPRIKAEILENDHTSLLRVLKEEAEESNLSSMTPSLTELEAALSDMLEKEEPEVREERRDESRTRGRTVQEEKPIEPEIVPVERTFNDDPAIDDRTTLAIEKDQSASSKGRKVSFCSWEEANRFEDHPKDDRSKDISDQVAGQLSPFDQDVSRLVQVPLDHPPAKPSRLHASPLNTDDQEPEVPTPPRRKNKYSPSRRDDPDDRLI